MGMAHDARPIALLLAAAAVMTATTAAAAPAPPTFTVQFDTDLKGECAAAALPLQYAAQIVHGIPGVFWRIDQTHDGQ